MLCRLRLWLLPAGLFEAKWCFTEERHWRGCQTAAIAHNPRLPVQVPKPIPNHCKAFQKGWPDNASGIGQDHVDADQKQKACRNAAGKYHPSALLDGERCDPAKKLQIPNKVVDRHGHQCHALGNINGRDTGGRMVWRIDAGFPTDTTWSAPCKSVPSDWRAFRAQDG